MLSTALLSKGRVSYKKDRRGGCCWGDGGEGVSCGFCPSMLGCFIGKVISGEQKGSDEEHST